MITQGTWYVETQETWYGRAGISPHFQGQISSDTTGATVALAYNDESGANTALIAAAPDLLAALRNLVKRNLIKDTDGDHYDEVLDAIAKAEGAQ